MIPRDLYSLGPMFPGVLCSPGPMIGGGGGGGGVEHIVANIAIGDWHIMACVQLCWHIVTYFMSIFNMFVDDYQIILPRPKP